MPARAHDLTRDPSWRSWTTSGSAAAAAFRVRPSSPRSVTSSATTPFIQRAGVVAEARRLGGPLTEIGELCQLKGWPPMAALVVRQDAGHPGVGYFRRADAPKIDLVTDAHLKEWEQDARACIDFARMPRNAPALMSKASKRATRLKAER